jgi:hypothetical protein
MAETRRLWEQEHSQAVCSLPSAQAATILGRIYFANGMDKMGWTTWSHALALADRLDLFAKTVQYNNEKDRISRTITAWGMFSQQAYDLTRTLVLFFLLVSSSPDVVLRSPLMQAQVLLFLPHEASTVPTST